MQVGPAVPGGEPGPVAESFQKRGPAQRLEHIQFKTVFWKKIFYTCLILILAYSMIFQQAVAQDSC